MGFWRAVEDWRFVKWGTNVLRQTALYLRVHAGRQPFRVGHLNEKFNKNNLRHHLKQQGFEFTPYSWVDDDEVFNMRKLVKDEHYQYHVRLYKDGEVKGHYEVAPTYHSFKHWFNGYFKPRKRYFRKLLKGFLGKKKRR